MLELEQYKDPVDHGHDDFKDALFTLLELEQYKDPGHDDFKDGMRRGGSDKKIFINTL